MSSTAARAKRRPVTAEFRGVPEMRIVQRLSEPEPHRGSAPTITRRRAGSSHIGRACQPGPGWPYDLRMAENPLRILVYSDNRNTRESVQLALGKRVHPGLPELTYVEVATAPMVIKLMDAGGIDLAILDGEATPAGGLGIAKQLKDELAHCPPILVLTGRPDDAWLASWSRAEAAVPHPIDPIRLGEAVVSLLRDSAE